VPGVPFSRPFGHRTGAFCAWCPFFPALWAQNRGYLCLVSLFPGPLGSKPVLFVPGASPNKEFGSKTGSFRSRSASIMHFGSKNAPICSRKTPAASLMARVARAASIDVGANPAAGLFVGNPKNAERDDLPQRWLEGILARLARPNCRTERSVMPRRYSEQRPARFAIIVLALASRSHRIDRLTRSG
jgi:hypothetical protein